MSVLISILKKSSSVKNICILFIVSHLVLLLMMLFTFPVINNQIKTKAFDLQTFGYSMELTQSILNNLNDQTTQLYLFPQLMLLDFLYPILLALFLSSIIFRLNKSKSKFGKTLIYIPFLAMVFDYLENICIALIISKSIEISEWVVFVSSSCTVLKSTFTSIAWVTILAQLIKLLILRMKNKKNNQPQQ